MQTARLQPRGKWALLYNGTEPYALLSGKLIKVRIGAAPASKSAISEPAVGAHNRTFIWSARLASNWRRPVPVVPPGRGHGGRQVVASERGVERTMIFAASEIGATVKSGRTSPKGHLGPRCSQIVERPASRPPLMPASGLSPAIQPARGTPHRRAASPKEARRSS